ncbi:MAG: STAS domain-containing protein [Tepidisphaeraceae bacterium]
MKIQESRQGAVTVLKPSGPLTLNDAVEFRTLAMRVLSGSLGRFLVDMSAIPFVDSQGLEALLDVTEQLGASGQMLKLCAANKTVREVMTLTGLSAQFEHFDDVNTAVRSFL